MAKYDPEKLIKEIFLMLIDNNIQLQINIVSLTAQIGKMREKEDLRAMRTAVGKEDSNG